jgi:hypothetical protein
MDIFTSKAYFIKPDLPEKPVKKSVGFFNKTWGFQALFLISLIIAHFPNTKISFCKIGLNSV